MSLDKTTLHNGASNKNVSDTVGNDICVTADSDMTSNHTKDISGNDEKRETKTKRRECNKEDSGGDKKPPSKEFTELDKYWKVVEDNPSDFTGWTYLLQYVEQEVSSLNVKTPSSADLSYFESGSLMSGSLMIQLYVFDLLSIHALISVHPLFNQQDPYLFKFD